MRTTRSKRIAIGTVCLIAIALAMGWFVGQYVPGTPQTPEPAIGDGLHFETGYVANEIVDLEPGSTLELRDITHGVAYTDRPEEVAQRIPAQTREKWKELGEWEYDAPDLDLAVSDVKVVTTKSFADWHPEYGGLSRPVFDSSKLVTLTATITNASSETVEFQKEFPARNFSLWGAGLDHIDDSLGAGAMLDDAYFFANEFFHEGEALLEPGASRSVILPFKVNKNSLKDQSTFENLDPSDFCLQLIDYDSGTAYRLWL